ncbi:hypothetical protein GCM10007242_33320 [Pigmentiphaga litoralis]|uniref:oligosaccharide flippase family protein n=1 Tax=Pigmentiphaga litoralis TaxID=516702 RepID=UPI0016772370|nr:oligosaccharide flippase family protein [Pigmentiphaga litoralis]GGX23277.1 hypothetical protein GCM10007242_33320 [Pigmentiphaga litoralis]
MRPEQAGLPPKGGRWQRATARFRNNASIWGLLEYGIGPLLAVVSTPLLFRQLGSVGFGQYAMVMALAGFGNAANIGAAVTATKLVSEKRHEEDGAYRGAAISAALIAIALVFVTVVAVIGIGITLALGDSLTFGGIKVSTLAVPALAMYLCQQLDQLFTGCLKGREDFQTTAICETLGKTATLGAACATAALTHSAAWASTAQALGLLLTAMLKMNLFARTSGRQFVWPKSDRKEMSSAFRFGGWSWFNSLSALAYGSVDRVLVGAFLGPTILAIYTVGAQVGQIIHTVTVALFQKAMPMVSRMTTAAKGDMRAAANTIRKLLVTNLLLSAVMTAGVMVFSHLILRLMLSADLAEAHLPLFQLLVVASGMLSLNVASHFSLLGLGNSKAVALLNGGAGLVSLLALWLLVGPLGESAAAWARILYSAVTLGGVWLVLRYLHGSIVASRPATAG